MKTLPKQRVSKPPWYLRFFYTQRRTFAIEGPAYYWEKDLGSFVFLSAITLVPVVFLFGMVMLLTQEDRLRVDYAEACTKARGVLYNDSGRDVCINDNTGQRIWLDLERSDRVNDIYKED